MAGKPRVLVIERDSGEGPPADEVLAATHEVVVARSMARALFLLRGGGFDGVYVSAGQLSAVRWAGVLLQADEILEAIADGVAVVDPRGLKILWANPEFRVLTGEGVEPIDQPFYQSLGNPEVLGPDPCPFTSALGTKQPSNTLLRLENHRFYRVTVTPTPDPASEIQHLIALTRDVTGETLQEQKINAIHKAGEELADLTPEELAELSVRERSDLLKYNISRHMKDLLGLDFIEIRLLEPETGRLDPLLIEGMTPLATNRQLYALKEGNGVTGFVASTGQSYLCPDTTHDPLYIEGAANARSSLTVPLAQHGKVIGTLNVESPQPGAFDERDRQFLEIYARSIASALNTLELLKAEKLSTATASVEAIIRELALPLDDILGDATTALDRYAGHDEDIVQRLRHLLLRAREIRGLIQQAGSAVAPANASIQNTNTDEPPRPRLADARILVVDAEDSIRAAAHNLLGPLGATVETARDAKEAIAFARQTVYSVALADIRLPDMEGYEIFRRLREVQPSLPVILMTGFGYDPTHSIVKARREGLLNVLYKPFRADRLTESIEHALRSPPTLPLADGFPPAPPLDH